MGKSSCTDGNCKYPLESLMEDLQDIANQEKVKKRAAMGEKKACPWSVPFVIPQTEKISNSIVFLFLV